MGNPRKALLHFTALGIISLLITAAASAQTAEQIADKTLAATVYLEMTDKEGEALGFGSGFFIGQNQIVTNFYVIEGAAKGTATQTGKSAKYTIEGVSATDEENNLAVLKVTVAGAEPLSLGDSETVTIGETVYVAGNPRGLKGTFSNDTISAFREGEAKKRFQMAALISPGNSGGPVLNGNGEVIGISLITLENGQNLNFAIPSNDIKKLLTQSGNAKPLWQGKQSISAETYLRWGYAKYRRDQYQAAIDDYEAAISLKPDFADAYYFRGTVKRSLGQYKEAIEDYDTAIDLKNDFAFAYHFRGTIRGDLGEHFIAIQDYNKAIDAKPDYAFAYLRRGIANYLLDRNWAAKKDWETALELAEQAGNKRLKAQTEKFLKRVE
ncbi:trypsin-like peptidase domain-containing protein [Candidatus Poribacteria bacterium]|nr:trypsin-like peptidase domain-containing protein [Candidatus Poribacteria bacterium]